MTKKERKQLIKAINFFLDNNPDKWVMGIDELCLPAYNKKWSDCFPSGASIKIQNVLKTLDKD